MVKRLNEENNVITNKKMLKKGNSTTEIQWTKNEKRVASFLSWGIICSLVIILVGGLWTLIDILLLYINPDLELSILEFFLELSTGVQILILGSAIGALFFLGIAFYLFIKRGHRYILKLLFKIKE